MRIDIRHLTRIEGHANLVVDARAGRLRSCRLEIVESPRFFEALLKGRPFRDVAPLVSRICGVCSNSHTLVSLMATEKALGITVSDQTRDLRRLLGHGEWLQSHILHLYFMALPDYFGLPGLLPMAKTRRDVASRALRLKRLANRICEVIGGRPVHPVTPGVGGFAALPRAADLMELRRELVAAIPDLEATVELFASLDLPHFDRETLYLSLDGEGAYPILGDQLVAGDEVRAPAADYRSLIEEYLVSHSTAKFARLGGARYMVGPLARFRNAYAALSPMAAKVAQALELDPKTANPYQALSARLVEVVQCTEEAIHLIDALLRRGLVPEPLAEPEGGGEGAAAVEAPRGTLFHAYTYDEQGCLQEVDCLIPTAQNLANIEADLEALVPDLLERGPEELRRRAEMLVRAYDPCISCSTHLLKVHFV